MIDNTVIPSFLGAVQRGVPSSGTDLLNNYVLRYGEVKRIVGPSDPDNLSGRVIEYEVLVVSREGDGANSSVPYRGVSVSNLFGGMADRHTYTYRADTTGKKEFGGNGSKVLVMCISGDQSKAIILGGMEDPKQPKPSQGHHYHFEFNGARLQVNSEGEVSFLHRGPTNADGSVQEQYEDFGGANVRFDKRGNIVISGPGGEQFLRFTNVNTADTSEDKSVKLQGDKKLELRAEQIESTAQGNHFIESETEAIQMTAARGVFVGSATDQWVKGTTYRLAEGAMNQTLASSMTAAASALTTASVSLGLAAGLNAIPIVGGMAAAGPLAVVAAQLAVVASAMGTMAGAIQAMEQNATNYLSKNWTD